MALFKKYVSDFTEIEPSEALTNYYILAGYKKNTNKISLSKLKELLNDNILIVTARYKDNIYTPDRTFNEVKQCHLNGIFPILRVIKENNYFTYYLKSYDGTQFVFEINSDVSVEDNVLSIDTHRFIFKENSFYYESNSLKTTQINLKYTEL